MKVNSGTIKLSSFSFQNFFPLEQIIMGLVVFYIQSSTQLTYFFKKNVHIQNRAKVNDIVLIYVKKTESNSKMLP